MFRLVYTRSVNRNLRQLKCNTRPLSLTSLSNKDGDKKHDDEEKVKKTNKLDINSLISSIEEGSSASSSNEKHSSLNAFQSLMKDVDKVKGRKTRFPHKTLVNKRVRLISKLKSQQGEEFLFQNVKKESKDEVVVDAHVEEENTVMAKEDTVMAKEDPVMAKENTVVMEEDPLVKEIESLISSAQVSVEKVSSVQISKSVTPKEGVDDYEEGIEHTPPQEISGIQLGQLKEDIKQQADNRDVSKLMSALIDDVDEHLPNPEEKLRNLMATMNINIASQPKSYRNREGEGDTSRRHASGRPQRRGGRVDFDSGPTTGLFSNYNLDDSIEPKHHKKTLHEQSWMKELDNLLPEHIPQNMFEVMMLDIDKEWKFPIDNEQDIGIEEGTSFEEHVFLDHLLDEFPDKEGIQKFMELVVTGLQQNPYLTVDEKRSRIMWYKEYFEKFPEEDLSF